MAGPRILVFGGRGKGGESYKDIYAFDPLSLTWYQGPEGSGAPSERFGHSAGIIQDSKMIVFGGTNGEKVYNDVSVLNLESMSWSKPDTKGPAPSPRFSHASVVIKNTVMIQGGFCYGEKIYSNQSNKNNGNNIEDISKVNKNELGSYLRSMYLNDIRLLQTENMLWVRLTVSGSPPKPRFGHTLNISGSNIIMFGGWSIDSNKKEENYKQYVSVEYFKSLNVDKLVWEETMNRKNIPNNRYGHTATTVGPHILIFGGWENNRPTNEVNILRLI